MTFPPETTQRSRTRRQPMMRVPGTEINDAKGQVMWGRLGVSYELVTPV